MYKVQNNVISRSNNFNYLINGTLCLGEILFYNKLNNRIILKAYNLLIPLEILVSRWLKCCVHC